MSVGVPQTFVVTRSNGTGLTSHLFTATLRFVTAASLSSLDAFMSAFIMGPCNLLLREPAVIDCLFAVAFDPQLASEMMLPAASVMIAIAATMSTKSGRGRFGGGSLAPVPSLTPSAIAAEAACTAAAISACGRRCLQEGPTSPSTELEGPTSLLERGDALLSLSRSFPAARHGVLIWLQRCLRNPCWLSTKLHHFAAALISLLRVYATYPQSQREVFEILKLVFEASNRAVIGATGQNTEVACTHEIHGLYDARRAALFALVDLAAAWHSGPEVLCYVEHTISIDMTLLKPLVIQVARKIIPPYSSRFARAIASLLSCRKAKRAWRNIDTFPLEDQYAVRSLASRVASILEQNFIHFASLSELGGGI
jgi:hypothetical protein